MWSPDGTQLLTVAADRVSVYDADGRAVATRTLGPGATAGVAVPAPAGDPGAVAPVLSAVRVPLAGPLKVLAAVAAPEETKTASVPLDTEAEMAAVLNAVAGITAGAQVRILEVASLAAIRQALDQDAYHVLHLSAHGSPQAVEL